jgi:hypothetical protein
MGVDHGPVNHRRIRTRPPFFPVTPSILSGRFQDRLVEYV